jgi:glycosyltransferase involved in cell wall biosynthesis
MNAFSEVDRRSEARSQRSEIGGLKTEESGPPSSVTGRLTLRVALLTGGGDKPYALGMAEALTSVGISVDFIGSDDLQVPELLANPRIHFLNLRGDQREEASARTKMLRVLKYYAALIGYVTTTRAKLFHILWHNKFEFFDRSILLMYYKLLGKKIAFTAHNVNAGKRDRNDSWLNRISLRIQYGFCDHVFVHTKGMKTEMISEFGIPESKVSVIPFGINNTVPNTSLSSQAARQQLGITNTDRAVLFFGNIAPYKGLEYLVDAFAQLVGRDRSYRLLIVGRPKGNVTYWRFIEEKMIAADVRDRVIQKIEYVPDEETELYFKAADVLVLPYTRVFQSGVLFLGYSFGLPAIAADVGSLKEEIIEGETGFIFKPQDSCDLGRKIEKYFNSELFRNLENRRSAIQAYANERYSWDKVAAITTKVYSELLNADS